MKQPYTLDPRTALGLIAAIVAVAAVIGISLSGDDTGGPLTTTASTSTIDVSDALDLDFGESVAPAAGDRPDVPPVECASLLTTAEIDAALGIVGPDDLASTMQFSRGESCINQIVDQPEFVVAIGPGELADFLVGIRLNGVAGVETEGAGEEALWFDDGAATGTLAIFQETPLGALLFRVTVGRPDVDGDTRLAAATDLAAAALPRFPGVAAEPAEPAVPNPVLVPEPEIDRSILGWEDNIVVRESEGDWTRAEGLIATLEVFAGERPPSDVLRHDELLDTSGGGVIRLARAYVESGEDTEAAGRIEALLDALLLSRAELDQLRAEGAVGSADGSGDDEVAHGATGGLVHAVWRVGGAQEEGCVQYYSSGCARVFHIPGGYVLIVPPEGETGWNEAGISAAIEAIEKAAAVFEGMGTLPEITFVLTENPGPTWIDTAFSELHTAYLNLDLKDLSNAQFQQAIAEQMARSLLVENFGASPFEGADAWWLDGLALFLSSFVFDQGDLEIAKLEALAALDAGISLTDRGSGTWLFFQHAFNELGPSEFTNFMTELNAIEDYPGIEDLWRSFNEALTGGEILDADGNPIEFRVPIDEFWDLAMVDPPYSDGYFLPPFGVFRLMITPIGETTCLAFEGDGVKVSSRFINDPSNPFDDDPWHAEINQTLPPIGSYLLMVTSVKPGAGFSYLLKNREPGEDCDDLSIQSLDPVRAPEEPSEPTPEPGGCSFDSLCGPSGFFHQMEQWLRQKAAQDGD